MLMTSLLQICSCQTIPWSNISSRLLHINKQTIDVSLWVLPNLNYTATSIKLSITRAQTNVGQCSMSNWTQKNQNHAYNLATANIFLTNYTIINYISDYKYVFTNAQTYININQHKKHNLLIDNLKHSNSHPRDDYTQRHKTNFFNNSHNAHKIGGSTGGTTCGWKMTTRTMVVLTPLILLLL